MRSINDTRHNQKFRPNDVSEIHVQSLSFVIINKINYLINILRDKETSLREYTTNQDYGLNVNNFVSTYKYDVIVLQEQITLYEKYLDFFYHVHEKLLKQDDTCCYI